MRWRMTLGTTFLELLRTMMVVTGLAWVDHVPSQWMFLMTQIKRSSDWSDHLFVAAIMRYDLFSVLFTPWLCCTVYDILYVYFSWRFSLHLALPSDLFDKTGMFAYLNSQLRMNEENQHLRLQDHLYLVQSAWMQTLRWCTNFPLTCSLLEA